LTRKKSLKNSNLNRVNHAPKRENVDVYDLSYFVVQQKTTAVRKQKQNKKLEVKFFFEKKEFVEFLLLKNR